MSHLSAIRIYNTYLLFLHEKSYFRTLLKINILVMLLFPFSSNLEEHKHTYSPPQTCPTHTHFHFPLWHWHFWKIYILNVHTHTHTKLSNLGPDTFVDSFPELCVSILLTPKVIWSVHSSYLQTQPSWHFGPVVTALHVLWATPALWPYTKTINVSESPQVMSHALSKNPASLPELTPSLSFIPAWPWEEVSAGVYVYNPHITTDVILKVKLQLATYLKSCGFKVTPSERLCQVLFQPVLRKFRDLLDWKWPKFSDSSTVTFPAWDEQLSEKLKGYYQSKKSWISLIEDQLKRARQDSQAGQNLCQTSLVLG